MGGILYPLDKKNTFFPDLMEDYKNVIIFWIRTAETKRL